MWKSHLLADHKAFKRAWYQKYLSTITGLGVRVFWAPGDLGG